MYELIHEDDRIFRLKDKSGKEFSIAKQAINDAVTQKIRGYAKGGLVTPVEDEQPSFIDSLPVLRDSQQAAPTPTAPAAVPEFQPRDFVERIEYGLGKVAQPFINPFMEKGMGLEGQADYERGLQQRIIEARQSAPGASPATANLVAGNVTADAMPKVPITQQGLDRVPIGGEAVPKAEPGAAPTLGVPAASLAAITGAASSAGVPEMMKAAKMREQAGIGLAGETLAAQEESQISQQMAYNDYAANMARLEREQADLHDSIMKSKIDPNRFFNDKTTAGKVSSVVGLILGGIGQGLAGGPNQALETLNKLVDRDIQAQRDNLGKKQSLFAANMQRLGDERAAWAATKAQIASLAQAKIEQAAARASIPTVKAAALEANAQIKAYQAKLNQEAAKLQTVRMITNHVEQTGDAAALSLLPADQQDAIRQRLVPGYGAATTKERAQKLQESVATTDIVNRSMNQLQAFGKKRYSDFSPEDRARATQIQQTLIGDLRLAIAGPGPLTKEEREWMEGIIANPTDVFELNSRARLEEIQRNVNYRLGAELKASGLKPKAQINFTPGVKK